MGQSISNQSQTTTTSTSSSYSQRDLTLELPDDVLAVIFRSLPIADCNNCALVSRRWFAIEAFSRRKATVLALSSLPYKSLSTRFHRLSHLTLRADRSSPSISDPAFLPSLSISLPSLSSLHLKACRHLPDFAFAGASFPSLVDFSASSCNFSPNGISLLFTACPKLKVLSLKRLRGFVPNVDEGETGNGVIALPENGSRLQKLHLKEIFNPQAFRQLIARSPLLESLVVVRCDGDWDEIIESMNRREKLLHLHFERARITDRGLSAVAEYCRNLEVLNLIKTPECTDSGIARLAAGCRGLRKVRIDGWKMNKIGDPGLLAIARNCKELKELVLIGMNLTANGLSLLADRCARLERLALCGAETIGDSELVVVGTKFRGLKKFCIKGCGVTDAGLEAVAAGCAELVKVRVMNCSGVSFDCVERLRKLRNGGIVIELDDELGGRLMEDVEYNYDQIGDEVDNDSVGIRPNVGLGLWRKAISAIIRRL